ncbi:hypothetical protein [Deinococcus marmoris]|uniref:hypothetical protein n=1 Tax=Deinococcus marmoris TaxID=249408 RepID=UPI00054D3CBB|nr:hypothetical protein [Deinococcus marmoris]
MATPDPSNLYDAAWAALGLIGGGIFTAFAKNFFTADGKDAREFRTEYREEIKRLRTDAATFEEEIAKLREDVRALRIAIEDQQAERAKQIRDLRLQIERLSARNQHYLITRTEARALLNALERLQGLTETPWGNDPEMGQGVV